MVQASPPANRIWGYSLWIRHDRNGDQGGDIAVHHCKVMQTDLFLTDGCDNMDMMFLPIIMENKSAMLLCAMYQSQWQGNASLIYLTDNLDNIMAPSCTHT